MHPLFRCGLSGVQEAHASPIQPLTCHTATQQRKVKDGSNQNTCLQNQNPIPKRPSDSSVNSECLLRVASQRRDGKFQRSIKNSFKFQSICYFFWNYNTNYFLSVKMSKSFVQSDVTFLHPTLIEFLTKQNLLWCICYFSSFADDAGFKRIICSHKLNSPSHAPMRGYRECGCGTNGRLP